MPTNSDELDGWQATMSAISPLLELFTHVIVARGKKLHVSFLAKFTGQHPSIVILATHRLNVTMDASGKRLLVEVSRNGWHKATIQYANVRSMMRNWIIV